MCRHVGWIGAPRSVASVVLEPPHGLLRQSYAPRRQAHGRLNADGWGVGVLLDGELVRWRDERPIWSATSLASLAPHLVSPAVLGAVRDATVGMPPGEAATAPFAHHGWLLSHNGTVDRDLLPAEAWRAAESVCDSAVLAAYLLQKPDELGLRVAELGRRDPGARLNVLATDGERLVATVWGDTLSALETGDGVALASEPWDDDPRWTDLPDRTYVVATADGLTLEELHG